MSVPSCAIPQMGRWQGGEKPLLWVSLSLELPTQDSFKHHTVTVTCDHSHTQHIQRWLPYSYPVAWHLTSSSGFKTGGPYRFQGLFPAALRSAGAFVGEETEDHQWLSPGRPCLGTSQTLTLNYAINPTVSPLY